MSKPIERFMAESGKTLMEYGLRHVFRNGGLGVIDYGGGWRDWRHDGRHDSGSVER